jgi:hypothetical protein
MEVTALINLAVIICVIIAVIALVDYLIRTIPIPDPLGRIFRMVVVVIGILIAIIVLLRFAGLLTAGPPL